MKRLLILTLALALCCLWTAGPAEGVPDDPDGLGVLVPVDPGEDAEEPDGPGTPAPAAPREGDDPEDPADEGGESVDPADGITETVAGEDADPEETDPEGGQGDGPADPESGGDDDPGYGTLPSSVTLVNPAAGDTATTDSMIRVRCPAEGRVHLRVTAPEGRVVYETVGEARDGWFVCGDIYLPLTGGRTAYAVSITDAGGTRTMTVVRLRPYLEDAAVWAGSLPLWEVTGTDRGARIALIPGGDGEWRFPLVAVGLYTMGEAVCTVADGQLTVRIEARPEARAVIRESVVRVAFAADDILTLRDGGPDVVTGRPDEPIPLPSEGVAVVWVQLRVGLDPAMLDPAPQETDPDQIRYWQQLDNGEAAVG